MVRVVKGNKEIIIPSSSLAHFKSIGWIEKASNVSNRSLGVDMSARKSQDEMRAQELEETPISRWSKEDVKFFADYRNIDTSEAQNLGQAREIVKEYLERR